MESLPAELQSMAAEAKELYKRHYGSNESTVIAVAPGRVNLIGEHTDYTGGFVFPLAIEYSTIIYGSGRILNGTTTSKIRLVSRIKPDDVEELTLERDAEPPTEEESRKSWTWYVVGVVAQYLADLPENSAFDVTLAVAGNVPLGGGLSSSASLEVVTARFLEVVLGVDDFSAKTRALRCQKAENVWCYSPCGIMDQYVSSAASEGSLLLIDCTSFEFESIQMKQPNDNVLVITNSNVQHSIGAGEYPVRVRQCKDATEALQQVHGADAIKTLRDANLEQVLAAKDKMDDVSFRRARHVVTENGRTVEAAKHVSNGNWKELGELMNQSHTSMRDDYEVSCEEIDILVDLAQGQPGVFGSRLTGGGFGGCTVTLVEKEHAAALMEYLAKEYKTKTGKDCVCFETSPGPGARLVGTDSV